MPIWVFVVISEMSEFIESDPTVRSAFYRNIPAGRAGAEQDMAAAILFLTVSVSLSKPHMKLVHAWGAWLSASNMDLFLCRAPTKAM